MKATEMRHPRQCWSAIVAFFVASACLSGTTTAQQPPQLAWPKIPRKVPPAGIDVDVSKVAALSDQLQDLRRRSAAYSEHRYWADVACLLKAVDLAIEHGEFYQPNHLDRAQELLDLAARRLDSLAENRHPWTTQTGLVIRGFKSAIDGSAQPYGLEVPDDLDLSDSIEKTLYVWLHGRGDRTTDLHFIHERMRKPGKINPNGAIVLHPFGRQCIGFKSAGETDVLEALAHVQSSIRIAPNRIVLMGFSMGGAGAWHLGAHFADRWVAVSPGAGFAETAEYLRLASDNFPPIYEQTLWGQNDVPAYTRNLFNLPVVAYSGENDKQIQAANVMARSFKNHGRELPHLVGPGMGHKYHPDTLSTIMKQMDAAVNKGRDPYPHHVNLQTRTLRYARMFWVEALRLDQHWIDTQIEADFQRESGLMTIRTSNVNQLSLTFDHPITMLQINQQSLAVNQRTPERIVLQRPPINSIALEQTPDRQAPPVENKRPWSIVTEANRAETDVAPTDTAMAKRPNLQGPIDDAFTRPFLVVLPSNKMANSAQQDWLDFEIDHLQRRWRELFRGDLRVKLDSEVSANEIQDFDLLLWGDPQANQLLAKIIDGLPIQWTTNRLEVGQRKFESAHCIPALIYPNPLNHNRYVVLNSGPTFRESHDRTNSLQNPKLPDWAVFDIRQRPDGRHAGRVVAADFFDENWQVKD